MLSAHARKFKPSPMALVTRVNGAKPLGKEMVKASRPGQMAPSTKDTGRMIKPTAEVDSSTLTVTSTRASGRTTKHMARVLTSTPMVPNTRANGKKISNTATEKKHGLMALSTKANTLKERKTAKAGSSGPTDPLTTDNS